MFFDKNIIETELTEKKIHWSCGQKNSAFFSAVEVTQLTCFNSVTPKTVTAKENERCEANPKYLPTWLQEACSLLPPAIQETNQNTGSNLSWT